MPRARTITRSLWSVLAAGAVLSGTVLISSPQVVDAQTVVALAAFPLEGPCRYYRNFGDYRSPTRTHEGEDIAPVANVNGWTVEPGHDVYAALPGTVKQVWFDSGSSSGAGNGIQITHAGGTYTRYYHLGSFASGVTTVGASVAAGQVLGTAGDTGTNDGNYHLHFELHPGGGAAIDPIPSLDAVGGCPTTSGPPSPPPSPPSPPPPPEPTPTSAPASTPIGVPAGMAAGFVAVTPERRLDTRVDDLDADGTPEALGSLGVARVDLSGVVPDAATAVALNLTATGTGGDGYLTAYPCGPTVATTSSLNYTAGSVVPSAVIVGIGEERSVCVLSYAPSHVVVDLAGWFEAGGGAWLRPIAPARVWDTRMANQGPLTGEVMEVDVLVPADAYAVALNVTAASPSADGWVAAWPCGQPQPLASNLNPATGTDVANLVNVGVGEGGKVCFASYSPTHLVVDVLGWYGPDGTGQLTPVEPTRVADTRRDLAGKRLGAGETLQIDLRTQALLPNEVTAVQATITAVNPAAAGFLTAYPCGDRPNASNLNYGPSTIVANSAQIALSEDGDLCVYSLAATDVLIDVTGVWGAL